MPWFTSAAVVGCGRGRLGGARRPTTLTFKAIQHYSDGKNVEESRVGRSGVERDLGLQTQLAHAASGGGSPLDAAAASCSWSAGTPADQVGLHVSPAEERRRRGQDRVRHPCDKQRICGSITVIRRLLRDSRRPGILGIPGLNVLRRWIWEADVLPLNYTRRPRRCYRRPGPPCWTVIGQVGGRRQPSRGSRPSLREVRLNEQSRLMSNAAERGNQVDADRAAFERFVAEHGDRLLHTAYGLCGDWQHAEDLVQQALTSVARRWKSIEASRSATPTAAWCARTSTGGGR